MGLRCIRAIREQNGVPIAAFQYTLHPIPKTQFTVGYLPKGPVPDEIMAQWCKDISKKHNTLYIQHEPNSIDHFLDAEGTHFLSASNPHVVADICSLPSFRLSHHPMFTPYTFLLDLNKSSDELLAGMHPKTRYNLKIAAKHGVTIQEDTSPEGFATYLKLSDETTERQGFFAHNHEYHETMWDVMRSAGLAHLFTATYQQTVLAAWIIFSFKETIYYPYGASSRDHRETMAPTLLLWEIAKWGKANGYRTFDLWGSMGATPDTTDPWYGFHRFKEGFRPVQVKFAGSFDQVINPLGYNAFVLADRLRWKLLNWKKR
jgi:lipid II:glycine glycyltransferase (peptidoglycan interpeptide bridge formation enzyme)